MSPFSKSILRTLAFYDAVGKVPLTKLELYKSLIRSDSFSRASFCHFLKMLDREWNFLRTYADQKRGFYFLKNNAAAYANRINGGKTGIKKWRIAKKMSRLISFIPYVRMVAITGSLALNTTSKNSDIDVLIAAKGGRIWTTRVLVSALTHTLGKRRYGKFIRDRICLNHYVSDSESVLRPRHLFSDHICSTFVPVWMDKSYSPSFSPKNNVHLQTIPAKLNSLYSLKNYAELILSKTIAPKLEQVLRALQMRKIEGRQFIADDNALVFHHPRPQNQEALYLYRQNLRQLNLPAGR